MKKNHSIINWEVYKKVKKPNMKISKKIYRYRKPFLGRMLDKIVNYWLKIKKRPLFAVLFHGNMFLLLIYIHLFTHNVEVPLYKWIITSFFTVIFGIMVFFDKNYQDS